MDKNAITIRKATKADAEAIQTIYTPYVRETAVSFEYDVPSVEEMAKRIEEVQKTHPWIVAEEDGKIVGYAYAHAFYGRAAYQWAVETSIYVDRQEKRKGIGKKLHDTLEDRLKKQGILNMNACIAYIEPEEEHLTQDSVRFHERMGYTKVAHFHQCGKKFGRWYDVIWMEKIIGEHV
jgi:phosphinothricin acetyltransferase